MTVHPVYPDEVRETLYTAVVGDVLDEMGRIQQFLPATIRPLRPEHKLLGRAMPVRTADTFGDYSPRFGLLTEALDQLEPGEIYVGTSARIPCAAWGEILTQTARMRGAAGAVVDAYHRDTTRVLAQDWPVFSWGPYAQDAQARTQVLDYRVQVRIGSVLVSPGDLILGDIDGVLVIPAEIEAEVIERSLERASRENLVLRAIKEGMSATTALTTFGVL